MREERRSHDLECLGKVRNLCDDLVGGQQRIARLAQVAESRFSAQLQHKSDCPSGSNLPRAKARAAQVQSAA